MSNTSFKNITRRPERINIVNGKPVRTNNDWVVTVQKNNLRYQQRFSTKVPGNDLKAVKKLTELKELIKTLPKDKFEAARILIAKGFIPCHVAWYKTGYPKYAKEYTRWIIDRTRDYMQLTY